MLLLEMCPSLFAVSISAIISCILWNQWYLSQSCLLLATTVPQVLHSLPFCGTNNIKKKKIAFLYGGSCLKEL